MTLNEILQILEQKSKKLQDDNLEIEIAIQLYKECQELIEKGNEIIKKANDEIEKVKNEF